MNAPSAEHIMRFRRASGLGVLAARQFLLSNPVELCERMLRANEVRQERSLLHDPIEDDPETAAIVAAAFMQAETEVDAAFQPGYFRGRCYPVWTRVERILREEHGLRWYNLDRMNPGVVFD